MAAAAAVAATLVAASSPPSAVYGAPEWRQSPVSESQDVFRCAAGRLLWTLVRCWCGAACLLSKRQLFVRLLLLIVLQVPFVFFVAVMSVLTRALPHQLTCFLGTSEGGADRLTFVEPKDK